MNPESPTPRELLEARLTALLLGELPPAEAAALREIIEKDPQLAALHARLKQTIELVRETAKDPAELADAPPAPLRLGEERREKLLAQFNTVAPVQFTRPAPRQKPWLSLLEIAALLVGLVCLAGLLMPALARNKTKAQQAYALDRAEGLVERRELVLAPVVQSPQGEHAADAAPSQPSLASAPVPPSAEAAPVTTGLSENREAEKEIIVLPSTSADSTVNLAGADTKLGGNLDENLGLKPAEQNARQADAGEPKLRLNLVSTNHFVGSESALIAGTTDTGLGEISKGLALNNKAKQPTEYIVDYFMPTTVATAGGSVVQSQNAPTAPAGVGGAGGRGGSIGGGGGGFGGGGGAGTLLSSAAPIVAPPSSAAPPGTVEEVNNQGQLIVGPGPYNGQSVPAIVAAERDTKSYSQDKTTDNLGVSFELAPPGASSVSTPSLAESKPTPSTGAFYFNSGAIGNSIDERLTAEESARRKPGPVRDVALAYAETQDAVKPVNEQSTAPLMQQSATAVGQNQPLQSRAQTFERNLLQVTPSYDSETHSVVRMSDDRTANSVSNSVKDLDASSATKQQLGEIAQLSPEKLESNAPAVDDRPLPKSVTPPSVPQPEVLVSENAFSTFSLNVSDVSFKLAAASLERGVMPDAGTLRSEEFLNAFDYRDPAPAPGAAIGFAWDRAQDPFAHNRDFLRFAVQTAAAGRQPGRPLNLVLLLDNSGSMERSDRVEIIHEALRVLAGQLQPQDTLSVVTFARTARLWVDGIRGDQAAQVLETVGRLTPEGGTNLGDALELAYATARRHYLAKGVNRVVLLTDGAANLGNVDPASLKKNVETQRKQGIALDCFGIGWEGYNDDLLEVLTRNGDGRYGFINTPEEAASGFAAQLAGALHVAASDVKVQVEFNPARVKSYRQIGYAKHQLTKEQFRDNTVNAAQIGAAESGNALYTVEVNPQGEGPVCTVRVRYRDPGTEDYHEHAWDVPYTGNAPALDQASPAMRLAATASAFSEWLASSPFAADVTPDALLGYLRGVPQVYGADTRPAQLESMIREAKSVTGK